jgi:hypothetical protein
MLRTSANDFDATFVLRMNRRSAREYTMFVPLQLVRNLRERRPSSWGDLDSTVMEGGLEESFTWGWIYFLFYFCIVIRDCCWGAF